MTKFVYDFAEGNRDLKDLLGGKGANLAEMTNLGLPVPPGFTITTEACQVYLANGRQPAELQAEVDQHLAALEKRMRKRLGQSDDPLLVSVRSGAKFSMPGMMDTVLNIGLNDASVRGLAAQSGNERFAFDSYRRLIQMFGKTVLGVEGEHFEEALDAAKHAKGSTNDLDLDAADLRALVETFKQVVIKHAGREFPQEPREQMDMAVRAVFDSWNSARAILYRRQERIPADLGTAVNICSMVFGNLDERSGTGVAFTRDPASGAQGVYGDYLQNAQGEDVVAGIRNTLPLPDLERIDTKSHAQLMEIMATLEGHYRDLCDIEFTIERGKLWMLQTRVGKRTAAAAFRIATQLVDEGVIDMDEAVQRVNGEQLGQLMFPRFESGDRKPIVKGMNASPGAAVGKVVFDSYTAVKWSRSGEKVILVRRETNPDDLDGMIAAQGILTSRGGKTSHAAVVARGMGKTCVCGVEALDVDTKGRRFRAPGGLVVEEGEIISIDGTSGEVFLGEVPVVDSPVVRYFEGDETAVDDDLVKAVDRIMRHADGARRMAVRANADNGPDAARARRFGAQGVGLCRTEHMFLGERRQLVEALILADTDTARDEELAKLLPLQRADFVELFESMDGLPVTIRLLDPPLHEFLPSMTDLSVRVAVAESRGEPREHDLRLLQSVSRLHEENPMLGLRGVRLGVVVPGLFAMQARAILEAAALRQRAGGAPRVEIMIPLVGAVQEFETVKADIIQVARDVRSETGAHLEFMVGTMIELPRAALTADDIAAGGAEFFSFGTNDLTQTTWGFSRDDVEGAFFSEYLEKGIFGVSPFESIDVKGVGELVKIGVTKGRSQRPNLKVGVCGEHGGDPESVHFFNEVGLDYVSCSPFRVPIARLRSRPGQRGRQHRRLAVKVLLVAPPGAGKGTQGAIIANHFGVPHIATGDLLRDHVARRTPLGRTVSSHLDRGDLVPDEVVLEMLRIAFAEVARTGGGYVLDGLPRTMEQAHAAYRIGKEIGVTADVALHLKVDDAEVTRRLLARAALEKRSDDTPTVIARRLALYHDVTSPILDWYAERGILITVDSTRPVPQVAREILTALEVMKSFVGIVSEADRRPIDLSPLHVSR